jgi:ADP-heptose:LPS heptosyltransferase
MASYKVMYANSKHWDGEELLQDKRVIVYCEQGLGDIIQFSRYFKPLRERGCYLIAHCPKDLHRLLQNEADEFLDKAEGVEPPPHDLHVLSMSLPFLLKVVSEDNSRQYLSVPEMEDLGEHTGKFKIGIAWEGSGNHPNNAERCCPLRYFAQLAEMPNTSVFMLHKDIENLKLVEGCEEMALYGVAIEDFYDTAKLINALDLVITVDTSILHLAGALGKKTYGLLAYRKDPRWSYGHWYDSVTLIKQKQPEDWDATFKTLFNLIEFPGERREVTPLKMDRQILLTGGIGDVLALECFFSNKERNELKRIYYATKASKPLMEVFDKLKPVFPSLEHQQSIWDDFEELFAFHDKSEVSQQFDNLPDDWPMVVDWSVNSKFNQIDEGLYEYNGSSLLKTKLAEVSKFNLPEVYLVLAPTSENNKKRSHRNFTSYEWAETLRYLDKYGLKGVLLGTSELGFEKGDLVIDLTGKTTMSESLEILKGAKGYIGIDSSLSVLAAKLFDEHLMVKSFSQHLWTWKHIYYAPKKTFDFIKPRVCFD